MQHNPPIRGGRHTARVVAVVWTLTVATAGFANAPTNSAGTLPYPGVSLCIAADPACEAVVIGVGEGGRSLTRYQPKFQGLIAPLDAKLRRAMRGISWHPGCPVPLDQLRVLTLDHWRPDGTRSVGHLIVAASVAPTVLAAFKHYFHVRFPITVMAPVHLFGASDVRSMATDNTSAFNCRKMTGGGRWSEHAFGTAVDINPLRNPYVKGQLVLPAAGKAWVQRKHVRPGMLVAGGAGVGVWQRMGWGWGGAWRTLQDFQHVSKTGR